MDLIALAIGFVAGSIVTALASHWLRKNKPATYSEIAEKAKKL